MPKPSLMLACFSAFFVVLFAIPLGVALANRVDLGLSMAPLSLCLVLLAALPPLGLARWLAGRDAGLQVAVAAAMATLACVVAVQANLLHPLSYFGRFDGDIILFRRYGAWFWIEWWGFLLAFPLLFYLLRRWPVAIAWAAGLAMASGTLALAQSAWQSAAPPTVPEDFDSGIYEFSRQANLVHLLPDGLQTDTVLQVLQENPDLAAMFDGFTLYRDHLGPYHGTAPALPALLTGEPFDFQRGHIFDWIGPYLREKAYPVVLQEQGWTVDMVPIHAVYCIDAARSCVPRPFNDWKSRGYRHYRGGGTGHALAVLADLSLYRMSPSFVKEKIHAGGAWFLAGMTADGSSPWPDPVLREWADRMEIGDVPASYRFYHYIGTHKPPFWSAACERARRPGWQRHNFEAQAHCVLKGLARFLQALRDQGIYDRTAIIISGDHGHSTPPGDAINWPFNVDIEAELLGTARPALLIKPMGGNGPLTFSDTPTSLHDIAEAVISLAQGAGDPFADRLNKADRSRRFYRYSIEGMRRWAGEPIARDVYRVDGPVLDGKSWQLERMFAEERAPAAFENMNDRNTAGFVRGAEIRVDDEEQKAAWVRQKHLGLLLSPPEDSPLNELALTVRLHLPDWIPQQDIRLSFNGEVLFEQTLSSGPDYWTDITVTPRAGLAGPGNHFVRVEFSTLYPQPGAEHRRAAALIGAAWFSTPGERY